MTATTLPGPSLTLGGFLRDRRGRLAPGPDAASRRRTPGLRREEVAARAGVSVTWYTWLEQGRGGPPSDEVLERLVRALELDATGREVLFLLAQQRPPPLTPAPSSAVTPQLQRMIDAMPCSMAMVRTITWDIVAWNAAARAILGELGIATPDERNTLRRMFGVSPENRWPNWEDDARFALASFRVGVARAGGSPEALALAAELQAANPDFRRLWAENELRGHWDGKKHFNHPVAGALHFEYATFAVDGAEGLSLVIFTPATEADARAVAEVVTQGSGAEV